MSARSGRWELLGVSSDPVPADGAVVQRLADVYGVTGQAIEESASKLKGLSELDGWTGDAAEKFAESAEDVTGDLQAAHQRYEEAGRALKRFVDPLVDAREESWGALKDAEAAEAELGRTAGDSLDGVATPTDEQKEAQGRREDAHGAAAGQMTAAKSRLESAIQVLDAAARVCAEAVRNAADNGKDGRWDNVKGSLRDFADWAHLDVVVKILTVLAIAIAAVGLGILLFASAPFWVTGLLIAGAVVGGLSLAANLIMASSEHEKGSWTNVALDIVGLVTLGASALFTKSAKAAVAAQRASAATEAATTARTAEAARIAATLQQRVQVANALKTAPDNPLRIWALGKQAEATGAAVRAGDDAAGLVTAAELRKISAELARIKGLPNLSPEALSALAKAESQLAVAGRFDMAGATGLAVNAGDLAFPVVDRFDDYIATVEWRLSR